jgi:membrane protein
MLKRGTAIVRKSVADFFRADATSRGAALSFYVVTSFVPVITIAIAMAASVFGEEAARGAIVRELRSLLGQDGAQLLEDAIRSAARPGSGALTWILSLTALVFTSSGVFIELRTGLNAIWHEHPQPETFAGFLWARVISLGMVVALGLLLLVSLILDAMVTAFSERLDFYLPLGRLPLSILNFSLSFIFITLLFATIFRILIMKELSWRVLAMGAVVTAVLFQAGKVVIGIYLGGSSVVSSFGAAGALIGLLFWVYYSAQIVFFGAALTKAYMLSGSVAQSSFPREGNA